jgi:hypothetical protein
MRKAISAAYRKANLQKVRDSGAAYRKANPKLIKAQAAAYHKAHGKDIKERRCVRHAEQSQTAAFFQAFHLAAELGKQITKINSKPTE